MAEYASPLCPCGSVLPDGWGMCRCGRPYDLTVPLAPRRREAVSQRGDSMKRSGVWWYGLVILVLSAIVGSRMSEGVASVIDAGVAMAVNWLIFVLPVVLIRNSRAKRKARRATARPIQS